jgi:hypothetical protein
MLLYLLWRLALAYNRTMKKDAKSEGYSIIPIFKCFAYSLHAEYLNVLLVEFLNAFYYDQLHTFELFSSFFPPSHALRL